VYCSVLNVTPSVLYGWSTAVTSLHSSMADSPLSPHHASQFTTTSNLQRILVAMSLPFIVNFATWNVCGLSDINKQHTAGFDSERYGLDIVALQEPKVRNFSETILSNYYKLFMFLFFLFIIKQDHTSKMVLKTKHLKDINCNYKRFRQHFLHLAMSLISFNSL
jgi:hypothetical protein